ncbi:MazG family protein [Puniceicoccales bacterium CK1056]|uniref:MazG family protein n=1 Tax=Oceanipulchritudo coccoides TaxID=2706888 RepID=A0A6B2M149_9BACT|nr:MazG family protein [Oceanipulchritudo coccoides]NDV62009.1 MazG family protein [Oceanipulchritudo coccoides]
MARLRGPGGCPWDHEQTHQSLCEPLIDETAELLDTIDRADMEHMCEELGDVLLQVVFHAQIAEENGHFNFDDVARGINEKLIRRHPHVFGDVDLKDSDEVLKQWEAIKAEEKKNGPAENGLFKRLPPSLPALMFAGKVARQIHKKGLKHDQLPDPEGVDALAEGLEEEEAGEFLYQYVCACQQAGIDPETALRKHSSKLVSEIEGKAEHV